MGVAGAAIAVVALAVGLISPAWGSSDDKDKRRTFRDGSGQLAGAVARGLIELATEPVALGPQLGCGQPPEI